MGIEKIGMVAKQLFTTGNAGKVGQKGKALLTEYTHLVGSKSCNPKDFAIALQDALETGRMPNFNALTGERIQYSKKFLKLWNDRQQLLADYTKLVGSKSSDPQKYAIALQDALETGRMPNFNALTGEKINHPKSFVKQFKAYQA